MNRRQKLNKSKSLVGCFFLLVSGFLFFISILSAFVLCIDQVDEWMNGWFYRNNWVPLKGHFWEYPLSLPSALLTALTQYPSALFASIIFFPLLIFSVPVFDIVYFHDFTFLLGAWLPFIASVCLFIITGLQLERDGLGDEKTEEWH